jgi:nitroreductase
VDEGVRVVAGAREFTEDGVQRDTRSEIHRVSLDLSTPDGPAKLIADTWAASAEAKRLLGIPAERQLREMISVGYPAEHLRPTPSPPGRKPLAELVHWDHY